MNKTVKVILITGISFLIYYFLQKQYFGDIRNWIDNFIHIGAAHFITYLIVGLPLFVGVGVIHNFKGLLSAVGLDKSIMVAVTFALVCTLPMLVGYAILFDLDTEMTWTKILGGAIIAGFIEELYFRGVLFGQIFRYSKVGFVPSVVIGALIFALGHLYQSQDFYTLVGIFFTTFLGAILFAWVYVEWKYNLWCSIFIHLFMNLFWMLFAVSDNALGGTYANIFRIITISLVIGLTILYKQRTGSEFEVNKNTLLMKKKA